MAPIYSPELRKRRRFGPDDSSFTTETARIAAGRPKSRSLAPLKAVLPFLRPYRGRIALALLALTLSSSATLVLGRFPAWPDRRPRVYGGPGPRPDRLYAAFVAAAAVLGVASATRFYAVTWLGERVVADIRKAVFDNVLRLSPQFFEVTRTGEVLSRMTADTTLIQTVVGSSASVAIRNLVTMTGGSALMFVTSLKLALLVVGAVAIVVLPILLFGRWVRRLSRQSKILYRRNCRPRYRDPQRCVHGSGLHPGELRTPRLWRRGGACLRFCA